MSNQTIELKWEWPAGRKIETKLLLRVEKIKPASKGLFGIGASPSLANALPEATDVSAQVLTGPDAMVGKTVEIQLPGLEARKLVKGEMAALGLLQNKALAVCIDHVPKQDMEPAQQWLQQWNCQ